jgi:hypothetical protein
MALNDVTSGAKVEDTKGVKSNWVRIADKSGKGFAEAYPDSPLYDHTSLKFNSNGDAVAYLEGDIIKVQAHWNDPNSFIFIKAQSDVPRNITIDKIIREGMGDGKYFEYVGVDRTGDADGRPTSNYIMPNQEHSTPVAYSGNAQDMASIALANQSNAYTPTYVQVGAADSPSIYQPAQSWDLKEWNAGGIFKYGDVVIDSTAAATGTSSEYIVSLSASVKGSYLGGAYSTDDFVLTNGKWYKATQNVPAGENPTADNGFWVSIASPLTDATFAGNRALTTSKYSDVTNQDYWTKTHFGA